MNPIHGIYGILPADLPLDGWLAKAEAAMRGGVRTLQLRDKQTPTRERLHRAERLRDLTRRHACRLIVNDDVDLARAVEADGLHVGPGDYTDLAALRDRVGEGMLLGVSCKGDLRLAERALAIGADYVSLGAIFATQSKADARVVGPAVLRQARRRWPHACLVAIGGMTLANVAEARRAGANAAAMIAGLFGTGDVEARAKRLIAAWEEA